jgi:hypothetical protein
VPTSLRLGCARRRFGGTLLKHVYIFQKAPICGIELDMLQATLKQWCNEERIEISSPRAEQAVIELIDWFQFGLEHPDHLIEMLRRS